MKLLLQLKNYQSYQSGIETKVEDVSEVFIETINRTKVELKQRKTRSLSGFFVAINRTKVELKLLFGS